MSREAAICEWIGHILSPCDPFSDPVLPGRRHLSTGIQCGRDWRAAIPAAHVTSSGTLLHHVCAGRVDHRHIGAVCRKSLSAAFLTTRCQHSSLQEHSYKHAHESLNGYSVSNAIYYDNFLPEPPPTRIPRLGSFWALGVVFVYSSLGCTIVRW